eukprot:m.440038 g.440038  ORF g.440038 m.440038 type:complete len:687 (+) comp18458_c0_seq1:135-2195(+)
MADETPNDKQAAEVRRTLSPAKNSHMAAARSPATRSRLNHSVSSIAAEAIPEHDQTISNYVLGKTVGKGNFAKVKLAVHKLTGAEVAIKIVDKNSLNESSMAKLKREVDNMKRMDHPNIVKLYEVIDTESTLYLVMEYAAGGEVFDYLVEHGRMKEKDARLKFRQIVSAVEYCHARGVIHRDLKAENLLLDANMNIKIADFGFSNTYEPGDRLDTFCGSPPYAAPELFQGKKYDGPEVDVWSLGVILYTLVSGSLPFDGQTLKELRERVLRGKYRIPFYMSQECEQLLKRFLAVSPGRRSSLRDVMKHDWMNKDCDTLEPYQNTPEPSLDVPRVRYMEKLEIAGFQMDRIVTSVKCGAFDHQHASYVLLGLVGWTDSVPEPEPEPRKALTRRVSLVTMPGRIPPLNDRPRPLTTDAGFGESSTDDVFSNGDEATAEPSRGPRIARAMTESSSTMIRRTPASNPRPIPAAPRTTRTEPPPALRLRQRRITSPESHTSPESLPVSNGVRVGGGAVTPPSSDETDDGIGTSLGKSPPKRGGILKGVGSTFRRRSSRPDMALSPGPAVERTSSGPKATPRVLRFTFSRSNTSARAPTAILQEIQRVLARNGIKCQRSDAFVLSCAHEKLSFEMEVCKMPRLSMHGIRHRRIGGDSLSYKNVCSRILQEMAPFLEGTDQSNAQVGGQASLP